MKELERALFWRQKDCSCGKWTGTIMTLCMECWQILKSCIMRHYPYTFDEARVRAWIERNMERYRVNGFGLWAVCLKGSGEMIGDCGLTLQTINGNELPEIGYHIRRDFQRRGYAKEAAKAVLNWVFRNTVHWNAFRLRLSG